MQKILDQIELKDVKTAIKNAEEIMNEKIEDDKIYVKKNFSYYPNPSFNIIILFDEIFLEIDIL